ncbi:hypothetical protein [Actinomadura roseirufa]|uniref:hypothetical protein n=1 Tax=Actinomadura roseirufa TaxID=2094049 RepID=UPI001040FDE6|nr:hypothetical protein [Actinomadura roseirufa]
MSERAAPFYCPYCGEEHLEPREPAVPAGGNGGQAPPRDQGGAWYCHDCLRSFQLKFLGVGAPRTRKENPL